MEMGTKQQGSNLASWPRVVSSDISEPGLRQPSLHPSLGPPLVAGGGGGGVRLGDRGGGELG